MRPILLSIFLFAACVESTEADDTGADAGTCCEPASCPRADLACCERQDQPLCESCCDPAACPIADPNCCDAADASPLCAP